MRAWGLAALLLFSTTIQAQLLNLKSGHLKGQYLLGTYPDDSLIRDFVGTPTHDLNADLRLLIDGRKDNWSWQGDYQMVLRSGDTLELRQALADNILSPAAVQNDDRRLMDLTHVISDNDNRILLYRMDRLHLAYTGDKIVVRAGRQAVSWGNGLIYNPVDFFNPFDPAAVDTEYKAGDDMLYAQYLQDSGNDFQFVSVWRRDDDGHTDHDVNTNALKYHAFIGEREVDVLLAQHYEDDIFTTGGVSSWGGAIVRGDIVVTHTDLDTYLSAVANVSYSWTWGGKNMSGVFEYFHNGLGLEENDYDNLQQETDLVARLTRGELFTVGKNYLAGGVTIEMTPLINISPNAFFNIGDGSGLAQLVGQYNFKQNWLFLMALNVPFGSSGTEFGGLDSGIPDKQLSNGPGVFAQIAFYF
ncbi:MAG: hypothetical protein V7709_09210 [Halioglobus sp.]